MSTSTWFFTYCTFLLLFEYWLHWLYIWVQSY